jgi:peptide/nickel transport system permease protein
MQPVLLWSDALIWLLVLAALVGGVLSAGKPMQVAAWRRVGASRVGMAAGTLLLAFVLIGLLDSLHYRPLLAGTNPTKAYAVEVRSALDALLSGLREHNEKTYSAPLASRLFAMEAIEQADGRVLREFPRLKFGGQHLGEGGQAEAGLAADVWSKLLLGLLAGGLLWLLLAGKLVWLLAWRQRRPFGEVWRDIRHRRSTIAWPAVLLTLAAILLLAVPLGLLAADYHVFGTDKVGQDVLYQVLKSVRTGLVIGLVTTLVTLPLAVFLGILAGYFGGWIDDAIQYIYTVLNSIPGVLLIAAAVLMMQVVIDIHPQWFATAAERADVRLLALCFILGLTSWTGLARLLRGETLKLKELEYIQAAQAFGVAHLRIVLRHILPNLMHIVVIALVMDFSSLVLAEAVLSYVGIGVDPGTMSFGTMINNARMELAREPMVWWSLAAAFVFMFALVLAANLFADAVRDAFDPRLKGSD